VTVLRGRLVGLVRPESRGVAGAVLLQAITVASGVGLMGAAAWLLSKAALHPSIAALQVAIVGVRAFGISRATFRYSERIVSHDVTLRVLGRLRARLFRALVPLAPAGLLTRRRGDLVARALDDVGTLENLYARLLGPTLAAVVVAVFLLVLLWSFDRSLPAAAGAGLLLAGVAAPAVAARLAEGPGRRFVERRGMLAARATDGIQGLADLLAFGREQSHAGAVRREAGEAAAEQAHLVQVSSLAGALVVLCGDLTAVAALALSASAVRSGGLDGVQLATVVLLTLAAFEAVAPLPQAWHATGAMRAAATRVFALEDAPPAIQEPEAPLPPAVPGAPLLELRALRFTYPGAPQPVLDGVDLLLDVGARVAVVGPSGSGKSTLAHLLLRFWESPPGAVLLEGRDLRAWPSDLARSRFCFAAQRVHLFTGSLRENLLLARPDATDEELRAALHSVRIELTRWPDGLDSPVGEQGHRLSGGERQRLALARALLRDAPLLLLDEPTAHLDPITERDVLATIRRAGEGRATLLVTHRLVGLDAFDEIVVLVKGRVAERGTARELSRRGGTFAGLAAQERAFGALRDTAFAASHPPPAHPSSAGEKRES